MEQVKLDSHQQQGQGTNQVCLTVQSSPFPRPSRHCFVPTAGVQRKAPPGWPPSPALQRGHLRDREGERTCIHLLSSAMLPTRVASKDCSMVLSSDWLNMGISPGLFARCGSLCRFRLSGRHSTPAGRGGGKEERADRYFLANKRRGIKPGTALDHTRAGTTNPT